MKNTVNFKEQTKLDLICLGRAGVDFYADQIGAKLEDATSFKKYVGGSSTNIAFGAARLGLKSSMLTRVGDEHLGRFIRQALEKEGCDVGHVVTDKHRLTAMVILGIKDRNTFPLIFVRENCADMALDIGDFDEDYIASAKALLITGTHFSTGHVHEVSMAALRYARKNGTKTVLDIDYRPVLWGLTGKGDGETRFVQSENVTEHLRGIVPHFDLIVGTEEEFFIAGGSTDILECLGELRKISEAVFLVKRGPAGCTVIDAEVPKRLDDALTVKGVQVEVLNVLGAGDAFMSGFLKGWLRNEDYGQCCRYANACGALVVSRHACSPSMPTLEELDHYLANDRIILRPDTDETLNRLHRKTLPCKRWKDLVILAFDHRRQMAELFRGANKPETGIPEAKELILCAFNRVRESVSDEIDCGVLIDDTYGQKELNDLTGSGAWIARPLELPGSIPLEFETKAGPGTALVSWPSEHIAKCLMFYHPKDKPELKDLQLKKIEELYRTCLATGHDFLLEIITPPEFSPNGEDLAETLEEIYAGGIFPEWWKLEPQTAQTWRDLEKIISKRDPHCKGILILGLNKPIKDFRGDFRNARGVSAVKGFAIGRSIFQNPLEAYLKDAISRERCIRDIAENYRTLIQYWTQP